jgi:hypothetical protein
MSPSTFINQARLTVRQLTLIAIITKCYTLAKHNSLITNEERRYLKHRIAFANRALSCIIEQRRYTVNSLPATTNSLKFWSDKLQTIEELSSK